SHNGNIGAVARALKNMGIAQLAMVNPRHALDESAYARSGHGADILKNAQIYTTLHAAIADCSVVYATRSRDAKIKWPQLDARHCALDVHQQLSKLPENAQIAILFGPERTG